VKTDIGGTPLSYIETKEGVQGGKYCLKGTRMPIAGLVESLDEGTSFSKQVATIKKYFKFEISEEELRGAVNEYRRKILG